MNEKFVARAKLIYERDKTTPLFLRVADFFLQNDEPQSAILILENGLEIYTDHPLALILLGKAHYLFGNIDQAELYLKQVSVLINSDRTFLHYKNEFNLPSKNISPFDSSRGNLFINSSVDLLENEIEKVEKSNDIEDNLQQIAEKLMNTRIERSDDYKAGNYDQKEFKPNKNKIVTETLANIYLSQNQTDEAIKIYELLASRNPEKKEYYLEKIREIRLS